MTLEDCNALHEMLNEFRRETAELEAQIQGHLGCIREAEAHLRAFENLEPEDKKVFSPRKVEILYKEEIHRIKEEKSFREEQNRVLCGRKAVIDERIKKLETVLDHEKNEFSSRAEAAKKQQNAAVKSLKEIIGKMEKSSAFIEKSPIQARQDFAIITKSLREIVDKMQDDIVR